MFLIQFNKCVIGTKVDLRMNKQYLYRWGISNIGSYTAKS